MIFSFRLKVEVLIFLLLKFRKVSVSDEKHNFG